MTGSANYITLTDAAEEALRTRMAKAPAGAQGILLYITQKGCAGQSYAMKYVESGDDVSGMDRLDADGVSLFVPQSDMMFLLGTELDFGQDDLGNETFRYNNPNQTSACGCGESVQLSPKNN